MTPEELHQKQLDFLNDVSQWPMASQENSETIHYAVLIKKDSLENHAYILALNGIHNWNVIIGCIFDGPPDSDANLYTRSYTSAEDLLADGWRVD